MRYTEKDRYSTDQRLEIVLDSGTDPNRWSAVYDNIENVQSSDTHITGKSSVSFDKKAGTSAQGLIKRSLDVRDGFDLDMFSYSGKFVVSVYISDLTNVLGVRVAVTSFTGFTDETSIFDKEVADLSVGWNHVYLSCREPSSVVGGGVDWRSVRYLAVGVSFAGAANTLTDILVDGVRLILPTHTVGIENVDVLLNTSSADTARSITTQVVPVQTVDATGKVAPAGEAIGNAPYVKLTDGFEELWFWSAQFKKGPSSNVIIVQSLDSDGAVRGEDKTAPMISSLTDGSDDLDLVTASGVKTTDTIVVPVQPLDADGEILQGGPGGVGGGAAIYSVGQGDLTATYTTETTITLAGLSFTPDLIQFIQVDRINSSGLKKTYKPDKNAFSYDSGTGVLTVTGADFAAGDLGYDVLIWGGPKAFTSATDSLRTEEIAPLSYQVTEETLADVSDQAIATYYYPSEDGAVLLGSKNLSINGRLACNDLAEFKLQITNDPNETASSRIWVDAYGHRVDTNTWENNITVSGTSDDFSVDWANLNCKYFRAVIDVGHATNTIKLFGRRTY